MDEDKREKIRRSIPIAFGIPPDERYTSYTVDGEQVSQEVFTETIIARERARLSVLDLTERDKRFLKSLKISV